MLKKKKDLFKMPNQIQNSVDKEQKPTNSYRKPWKTISINTVLAKKKFLKLLWEEGITVSAQGEKRNFLSPAWVGKGDSI